jgi:ribosomal protein S6--L-glutamate ligase
MKIAIISQGSKSSQMTAEACRHYFEVVEELDINKIEISFSGHKAEILHDGEPVADYDVVYAKGSFRYAPLLTILTALMEDKSYMPIRRRSFNIAHDKLITQVELQKHKLPMPKTFVASTVDAARALLKKLNYPIILKFPQGTHGKGVVFCESYGSAGSVLDALTALKQPFIIQEFVDNGGVDVRAIVVGNKVVAAMKRKAAKGDARSNLHAQGTAEAFVIDDAAKEVCLKVAESVGAEVCGVDYLDTPQGPKVLEVNLSPGLQGITEFSGINVAGKIAEYFHKKAKERRSSTSAEELITGRVTQEVMGKLDFRANRIVMPQMVSKITSLTEFDDVKISMDKKKFVVEKL